MSASPKKFKVPSGFSLNGTNGTAGIPVGPISVVRAVNGSTVYRLFAKSVTYQVAPSRLIVLAECGPEADAGAEQSASPVGPMTDIAPVAGLIASRFPLMPSVNREPAGPGTSPVPGSARSGPIC